MPMSRHNQPDRKRGREHFSPDRKRGRERFSPPDLESLDPRIMLSVTASFSGGTLRVTGDDQNNVISISRDVAGNILVNNGAIPIAGAPATIANTDHLHLVGAGGNDTITLN